MMSGTCCALQSQGPECPSAWRGYVRGRQIYEVIARPRPIQKWVILPPFLSPPSTHPPSQPTLQIRHSASRSQTPDSTPDIRLPGARHQTHQTPIVHTPSHPAPHTPYPRAMPHLSPQSQRRTLDLGMDPAGEPFYLQPGAAEFTSRAKKRHGNKFAWHLDSHPYLHVAFVDNNVLNYPVPR